MTTNELKEDTGFRGTPNFATFSAKGVYSTVFALRLIGIGVKPSRVSSPEEAIEWEAWQELWRQRFIAGLLAEDKSREIELRYIVNPLQEDGKLQIAVIGKTRSMDENTAINEAKELYADIEAVIQTNASTYVFSPVDDENELLSLLEPFTVKHLVEISRTGVSFCESNKSGFQVEKEAITKSTMIPYGIAKENSDLRFLCQLMVESQTPLMLCVRLVHTTAVLPALNELGIIEDNQTLSPEICAPIIARLAEMAGQSDELCLMRIFIAATEDLPGSVVRMVGCELLTDDAKSWEAVDLQSQNMNGFPSELDLTADAQPSTDLTRVYTKKEATFLFRMPLPGSNQTPGIPRIHTYLPQHLSDKGTMMGFKTTSTGKHDIRIAEGDKGKHVYVLGQTGTGKSTLLHSMAMSDIRDGRGLCVIDPHGDLLAKILSRIPDERRDDVVLFDPTDTDYPVGLNILDARNERDKSFMANELILIFRKLYDPKFTGMIGPQFEQAVRNAALTAMSFPEGGTVIDVPTLLMDREYAKSKLQYVKDEYVLSFWNDMWFRKSDFHVSEIMGYITSKFDGIRSDPMMRRIIGQSRNALDFRKIMDEGRILLVNLSKGGIGELNSALLGSILVAKLFSAALSRQNVPSKERKPFTLYLDEFHNFTTDTVQSMLSEARKYRLSLVLAHQNLQQLPPEILQSVLGNVGSTVFFRPGPPDVKTVAEYMRPYLSDRDLIDLPNWTASGRLLIDGMPSRPFVFQVARDQGEVDYSVSDYIRERMHNLFGQQCAKIDEEIHQRLQKSSTTI